jgi:hypothetical protein
LVLVIGALLLLLALLGGPGAEGEGRRGDAKVGGHLEVELADDDDLRSDQMQ